MAGEDAPKPSLKEALPGIEFSSSREVEASTTCTSEDELHDIEKAFKAKTVGDPERVHLVDIRIRIKGFDGVARVRTITQPHREPPPDPVYEWAVKIAMPRDGLTIAKAPIEHQGPADSPQRAEEIIRKVIVALGYEYAPTTTSESHHDRTIYTFENGVKGDINVCTWKDGEELQPPHRSAEFERTLSEGASDPDVKAAEAVLIETATSVGIPVERLSSSRGLNNQEASAA